MLAKKYRPKRFSDVLGQKYSVSGLQKSVQRGDIRPLWMLHGGSGTGKTTLARIFAMAILCDRFNEEGEPCGGCSYCVEVMEDRSLHYMEIDAASMGNLEDIQQIKQETLYQSPDGKPKIVVLDECHQLSKAAQQSLLKLFEEGSTSTIFILCTTELHKVLDTIYYRSIPFELKRVPDDLIVERLMYVCESENIDYDPDALTLIARHVRGNVRRSLMVLDKFHILGSVTIDLVRDELGVSKQSEFFQVLKLISSDPETSLDLADKLVSLYGEESVYEGLVQASLEAYRFGRGLSVDSLVDIHLIQGVFDVYRDSCLAVSRFLLKRPLTRLTKSHLMCDLLMLDQVVNSDLDLWTLIQEGRAIKIPIPTSELSNSHGNRTKREQKLLKAHKKSSLREPVVETEKIVQNVESDGKLMSINDAVEFLGLEPIGNMENTT